MFYLFHGADAYAVRRMVDRLHARLSAADAMADLNTTRLDGARLGLAELREAADALPFMSERRMVVVDGLVGRCNPRGGERSPAARKALSEGLKDYLPDLPPSTRLVLAEGTLHKNNPVLRWAETWLRAQPDPRRSAVIQRFDPPKAAALPAWLAKAAVERDGEIRPAAARRLAESLTREGEVDLFLAVSELEKLLVYAAGRAVTEEDVARLVTPVSVERVFELTEALADRDGPRAASLLHRFLELDEPPLRLLALVARQFRLLLLTRSLLDAGVPAGALAGRLPVPPFVVRKLTRQARRFSTPVLEAALTRLRDIDTDVKTGRVDPVLALDLFVAGVCHSTRHSTA